MYRPIDVATRDTVAFIAMNVRPPAEILEVGCGSGHVALALASYGYSVTGIDADDDCIRQARALGVDAAHAEWHDYDGPAVDAIAFTRSLHHMHPLDDALEVAERNLRPGGRLVLEDFAINALDDETLGWLAAVLQSDQVRALCRSEPDPLLARLPDAADRVAVWREEHHHEPELHSFEIMRAAIDKYLRTVSLEYVPYLYRYLIREMPETRKAANELMKLFSEESCLGRTGKIRLIGRRVAAVKQD